MDKIKVLYITPFPPQPSGIADYAAGFAAAIARFCDVDIATPSRGDRLSHSLRAVREEIRDVRQRLQSDRYDIVHVELGRSLLVGFFAAFDVIVEFRGTPLVLTLHDPPGLVWHPLLFAGIKNIPLFNMAWAGWAALAEWLLERSLYRHAAMLLTFSHRGRDLLLQQKGRQDIGIIPMGVPIYPARPAAARIRIGYYGYLYREKGVEVLINALALLMKQQPRLLQCVDITICGTVSRMSNVGKASHYRQALHKLIVQRRLQYTITMASDLSPQDEERFLLTTDILVLPYLDCDTLAMSSVLVKGLAAGCAVVVSDVKAFSEVIEHGQNGLLVPPHDPRALAQYLSYLIGQRHEIVRLGTEARRRSERCNSWPVVTGRMTEIYTDVLDNVPKNHDRTSP